MGFEKEISQIVTVINERKSASRQTMLLSATLSPGVERLAGLSLNDPTNIDASESDFSPQKKMSLSSSGSDFTTPEGLKHYFVITPSKLRLTTLTAFILWKCKVPFRPVQSSTSFYFSLSVLFLIS